MKSMAKKLIIVRKIRMPVHEGGIGVHLAVYRNVSSLLEKCLLRFPGMKITDEFQRLSFLPRVPGDHHVPAAKNRRRTSACKMRKRRPPDICQLAGIAVCLCEILQEVRPAPHKHGVVVQKILVASVLIEIDDL